MCSTTNFIAQMAGKAETNKTCCLLIKRRNQLMESQRPKKHREKSLIISSNLHMSNFWFYISQIIWESKRHSQFYKIAHMSYVYTMSVPQENRTITLQKQMFHKSLITNFRRYTLHTCTNVFCLKYKCLMLFDKEFRI